MKRFSIAAVAVAALAVGLAFGLRSDGAEAQGPLAGQVVSAFGLAQIQGEDVIVHVAVVVPPGQDARAVAERAVRRQGAQPISAPFSVTGVVWPQFSDGDPATDFLTQNYNPTGDPTGGGGAAALTATHTTWSNVQGSAFVLAAGDLNINRCPSTVYECGNQTRDGLNDVAWMALDDPNTLGVTWYWTAAPFEADMAMNTNFSWSTNGAANTYDVESVFLHENGHVAGLGHSPQWKAVMYFAYLGVDQNLDRDDKNGIKALYPASSGSEEEDGGGGGGGPPCSKKPNHPNCDPNK